MSTIILSTGCHFENSKICKVENVVTGSLYILGTVLTLDGEKSRLENSKCPIGRLMKKHGVDYFTITLLENFPCKNCAELDQRVIFNKAVERGKLKVQRNEKYKEWQREYYKTNKSNKKVEKKCSNN